MTPLLTQSEACRLLGVSPKTLQNWRRAKKIAWYRIGHCTIRYRQEDLEKFKKSVQPAEFEQLRTAERAMQAVKLLTKLREQKPELYSQVREFAKRADG